MQLMRLYNYLCNYFSNGLLQVLSLSQIKARECLHNSINLNLEPYVVLALFIEVSI